MTAIFFLTASLQLRAASATDVMLAWDPSPSPEVSGYRVHYGLSSGFYTSVTDAGNSTTIAMPGLLPGVSHFFAITAYDAFGRESDYSNEAVYTPTVISDPETPTMRLNISFQGGVKLAAAGPAGRTYDLLASQDLKSWAVIKVVSLGVDGRFEFVDPEASKFPTRFYRARETEPSVQLHYLPPGQPAAVAAGEMVLSITGQNGRTYDVLASSNLMDWEFIGSVTLGPSGQTDFLDEAAVNYPTRFYRTRERKP